MTASTFIDTAFNLGWDVTITPDSFIILSNVKPLGAVQAVIRVPYPQRKGLEFDYASYVEEYLEFFDKDHSGWLYMTVEPETGADAGSYDQFAGKVIECREDIVRLLEALRKIIE